MSVYSADLVEAANALLYFKYGNSIKYEEKKYNVGGYNNDLPSTKSSIGQDDDVISIEYSSEEEYVPTVESESESEEEFVQKSVKKKAKKNCTKKSKTTNLKKENKMDEEKHKNKKKDNKRDEEKHKNKKKENKMDEKKYKNKKKENKMDNNMDDTEKYKVIKKSNKRNGSIYECLKCKRNFHWISKVLKHANCNAEERSEFVSPPCKGEFSRKGDLNHHDIYFHDIALYPTRVKLPENDWNYGLME